MLLNKLEDLVGKTIKKVAHKEDLLAIHFENGDSSILTYDGEDEQLCFIQEWQIDSTNFSLEVMKELGYEIKSELKFKAMKNRIAELDVKSENMRRVLWEDFYKTEKGQGYKSITEERRKLDKMIRNIT